MDIKTETKKESGIKVIDLNIIEVCKSIYKISYAVNNIVDSKGSGFFIKLYKDDKELFCLMTNHHVINKELIESNIMIDIKYDYEKKFVKIKLDKNQRFIYYDSNFDVTIIEILQSDKIKEKFFLFPNKNKISNIDQNIYILQYPGGEKLSYSEGKIKKINVFEIIYDASTKEGSSGSPIFLKTSNGSNRYTQKRK